MLDSSFTRIHSQVDGVKSTESTDKKSIDTI